MRDEPDNHRRFKQTRLCGLISTKLAFPPRELCDRKKR
jgi:hypothetical protein